MQAPLKAAPFRLSGLSERHRPQRAVRTGQLAQLDFYLPPSRLLSLQWSESFSSRLMSSALSSSERTENSCSLYFVRSREGLLLALLGKRDDYRATVLLARGAFHKTCAIEASNLLGERRGADVHNLRKLTLAHRTGFQQRRQGAGTPTGSVSAMDSDVRTMMEQIDELCILVLRLFTLGCHEVSLLVSRRCFDLLI